MSPEEFAEKYTNGNLLQAKVILDMGYPWDVNGCIYNIFIHDLEILKFLKSLEIPFSEDTFTKAVCDKEGCPWNQDTFEKVLYNENYEDNVLLKWMIKEDCPREPGCLEGILHDYNDEERDDFMLWVKDGCK